MQFCGHTELFTQSKNSEIELGGIFYRLRNKPFKVTTAVTLSKIGIHAAIRFVWLNNFKPAQIHTMVCKVYGENVISRQICYAICLRTVVRMSPISTATEDRRRQQELTTLCA